ncbi:MAG: S-layer homology domain-containing protein [Oscillospiraceae bacterium]
MKMKQNWKKSLALLLAMAMCLSLVPAVHVHAAGETGSEEAVGEASSSFEPWGHGYRFVDILNFDPASDPYSQELVASVPLQERNATFAATQANKDLSDDSKLYVISSGNYRSTDVNEAPWNAGMSYDEFSYNLFKFWQYADMVGAGGRPTQNIAIGSSEKEYGIIAIPMAAATNAAHKNGVITLAEYFIPRRPQYTEEWLYKDENGEFPYAKKLVELAKYYGFDGYFINQEEEIDSSYVPLFREMLKYMRDEGVYIQWYDSIVDNGSISYQNAFNNRNSGWIWNETNGRVTDSIFLNYWYGDTALKDSKAYAEELGLDPYEVVFMGVEGGGWRFDTDIETWYDAVDENGKPYTSFAIWGSDWYHEQFHKPNGRYQVGYQWEAEERERMYYTSATENAGEYSTGTVQRDDISYDSTINFQGFSKYVVEKSVIHGTSFASDFNNGHGMQYFVNGQVSRDMEWTNLNLQDILPTWQWWITSTDDNRLELDWDYGSKFYRYDSNGETYAFPYTQIGAYNGGSSLVMYGDLLGSQTVNLYKTELDVTASSKLQLTYNKPSADDTSRLQAAIVLKDGETGVKTVYLPIENSGKKTDGWTTATLDLSAYAGQTIAAIALELSATEKVEGYQLNLGRLVVTDGKSYTPDTPTGLKLLNRFDGTGEVQLGWELGGYDTVKNYHVYAGYADGSERFVGGAYAANYYIQTLEDTQNVTCLKVRAVGADGSESEPAVLSLEQTNRVSNVRTTSADGKLNVTWTDPEASFDKVELSLTYWYSETPNEAQAVTAAKGAQKASFNIVLEDGAQYILTLATVNADGSRNEAVSYFGDLTDKYCAPYDGQVRINPAGNIDLTMPSADDWNVAYVELAGNTRICKRVNGRSIKNLSVSQSGLSTMTIILEDMDGNKSEPVSVMFLNGRPADLETVYGEDMIPDPVLRAAIQEKVGPTIADLIQYVGELDLSGLAIADLTGLKLMPTLSGVNLSGTAITKVTADMLPAAMVKLDLTGCKSLTEVNLDNRTELTVVLKDCTALTTVSLKCYGDHPLDLSGCTELLNLDLSGTAMQSLNIKGLTKLHMFNISDSQIAELTTSEAAGYTNAYNWNWKNAKLDLTDGTSEGALKESVKNYFATTDIPDEYGTDETLVFQEVIYADEVENITDLYATTRLSRLSFTNPYDRYEVLEDATIEISVDGENYTKVADMTGATKTHDVVMPEGTDARYVRITNVNKVNCYTRVAFYGYTPLPKAFTYDSQRPAMERDALEAPTVLDDGAVYQMLDLLEISCASVRTVKSGTLGSELVDADWIDKAYLAEQTDSPTGVKVEITAPDGTAYVIPTEGPTLGIIDRENKLAVRNSLASGGNNGEGPEMMFDGIENSKWCTSGHTGWAGFELEAPAVIGEWYTLHAGSESRDAITRDFRLQYLNPKVLAEADYMAMSDSEKRNVLRNSANWLDLDVVTGNTDDEVTREINLDNLATAQVYRLYVDESQQTDFWGWNIRILELQLFAYTGQLGTNTNGLLKADTAGVYQISYTKAGEPVAATTFTVEHDILSWEQTKEATCTEEGEMKRVCANCGLEETITLAALGHQFGEGKVTKEATCEQEGEMTYTCTVCGETHTEAIAKAEHQYTETVTAPTCEGYGYTTHTCAVCGHSYVDAMTEPTGHSYETVVTEPTCDTMGYTTHTCSVCGDSYIDTFVPATDHDYEQTVTKEATCTQEGEMTFTCKHEGCGKTYTMPIPKREHDCATTIVTATCLGYGYTEHTCKDCGYSYISDLIQPRGHSYEAVVTAPTPDEGGYTTHTCTRCGDSYVDELTEALGHKCAAFTDISGHWAKDFICFATEQGLFQGVTDTTFVPDGAMSRAMAVTVLYRLAGEPEVTGETAFTDVNEEAYYYRALLWASQNEIAKGMTGTAFAPNASVTREQLVTFLYRYAKLQGEDVTVTGELKGYTDTGKLGDFAMEAMTWAVENEIINGMGGGKLAPKDTATRAQFATVLMRFLDKN